MPPVLKVHRDRWVRKGLMVLMASMVRTDSKDRRVRREHKEILVQRELLVLKARKGSKVLLVLMD